MSDEVQWEFPAEYTFKVINGQKKWLNGKLSYFPATMKAQLCDVNGNVIDERKPVYAVVIAPGGEVDLTKTTVHIRNPVMKQPKSAKRWNKSSKHKFHRI